MPRLILPDERTTGRKACALATIGLIIIPAIIIGLYFRPYSQEHIGLLFGAIISGGFVYWTIMNLASGIYRSKQGNYARRNKPVRYWIHTVVIALITAAVVWFQLHQIGVVISLSNR